MRKGAKKRCSLYYAGCHANFIVFVTSLFTGGRRNAFGTVTDASGAVVPDVQTSLRATSTGLTTPAKRDSAGFDTASNLVPGNYEVAFSAQRFATVTETSVVLEVREQRALNRTSQVGQATQKVEVTATAATVELASSTITARSIPPRYVSYL